MKSVRKAVGQRDTTPGGMNLEGKGMVELLQRGAYERSVAETARGAGFKFRACAEVVPRMKLAERVV